MGLVDELFAVLEKEGGDLRDRKSAVGAVSEPAASEASASDSEVLLAEVEAACESAFSHIASSMTPAALAWAEAANPEAFAAYRETERRVIGFPTPATP
ncbi:MAG: hypothetical protein H5T97_03990, partial [Firmicutes bacterium]|nr:hypothetical protein [Bacillota bacterium]